MEACLADPLTESQGVETVFPLFVSKVSHR